MHDGYRTHRGFTLLELIIALVILAIISLGIGSYLRLGASGYVSTVDRERLQSEARFVIERLSREVRHAAPNSVRINDGCLSFYPVYLSAFYFDQPSSTASEIEIVPRQDEQALWAAKDEDGKAQIANSGIAVGFASAEQYGAVLKPTAVSATISGGVGTLSYTNPINSQSPAKRLYLYGEQVSFCFDGNRLLTRQENDGDAVIISNKLDSFKVEVSGAGLNSNGVVHMALKFADPRTSQNGQKGETSNYNHSVQVINVL
ncbi:prepilin-type N-terminal cleavage/methylation domain-containing protein [Photobacterium sp. SDRW27]|uniref:prepilin-type N-terminal cleavage/methylation domain-containing protein n=1 Tax=Photobacterium obscurum TaxID=2829490 RepID=UPI002244C47C|nr:prepilin-type N-terminal cleavage/methylation domain-containing protein [Photobacterium obscurum]MCW8330428.1 prepilin-type N-terminal cleavage/methylation domain-containing protein [Photobacterium obscurum]